MLILCIMSCADNPDAETQPHVNGNDQVSQPESVSREDDAFISADPEIGQDYSVDLGDNVFLEMVWIPGGTFLMGSPENEEGRQEDEGPQTEVTLDGFWMGKYEVTQEQFEAITGDTPSSSEDYNHPVETVSWFDAMGFCDELSYLTGDEYTLPTEAQWEYACRAGSTDIYYYGDDPEELGSYSWYVDNSDGGHHTVGSRSPNEYGLYDMHGNVNEWCLSLYGEYENYDDSDGRNSLDDATSARVLRGGSWGSLPELCRSADRGKWNPEYRFTSYGGFRCVMNP